MANSAEAQANLTEAHRELMKGSDIQWTLPDAIPPQPPKPPEVGWLSDLIGALGPVFQALFWPFVILVGAAILYFILRDVLGLDWRFPWQKKMGAGEEAEPEWAPDQASARTLLSDADALAASGDYAGAAHLLLKRSVEEFATKRPQYMLPSLTSRDISTSHGLPEMARSAFGHIARVVEASFFGGGKVDKPAWDECRTAYERYALRGSWAQ